MRVVIVSSLVLSLLSAGCIDGIFDSPEPDPDAMAVLQDLSAFPEWRMETDQGTIRMVLYTGWLPGTAGHMIRLSDRGFYDGTTIHRVVDDFVIQGGDPTGTGEGGSGPSGTSDDIPLEIYEGLDFGSGAVGLARWTDDTGDSQYFITEKPAIHLSRPNENGTGAVFGAYSLFAQVFEGQDVVRRIAEVETDANDKPVTDVVLHTATILDPPTDADLLNLIMDVHAGVSTQGYQGDLEVPRIVVTDHPTPIRFTTDTVQDPPPANTPLTMPEQGQCSIFQFGLKDPEGAITYHDWVRDEDDPCTFEVPMTFEGPGEYVIDLGVDEVAVTVLPWHDDYGRFTGTAKTDV